MIKQLLIKGNSKLGPDIWTFSLPIGQSCICKTSVCDKVCYVKEYCKRYSGVERSYQARFEETMGASFVPDAAAQIILYGMYTVRIHVSGDFYSPDYVRKWVDIAKVCSKTTFVAYTRTWVAPHMIEALAGLKALPNVILYLSMDKDNRSVPVPYALKGCRTAYLSLDDVDLPPSDTYIDFRHDRSTVQYKLNGVRVCPHEYGRAKKYLKVKCSKCLKCYG